MSTLGINNDVRSVFIPTMLPLLLIFIFPPSPPKILSFFRRPPNLSQKNDDFGLIHRWIVVKFKHQVHNLILSLFTVGNYEKMLELR